MKRSASFALAFCAFGSAAAQDNLEPEDSVYQGRAMQDDILLGYDRDITRKFSEIYDGSYAARAIILHAFDAEYAVAISANEQPPKIIGLKADRQLYAYWWMKSQEGATNKNTIAAIEELRASMPPSIDAVRLHRCEIPTSDEDRKLYIYLWKTMLFRARYSEVSRFGLDGVTYHFSGEVGHQQLAGKIWRPSSGSITQRFSDVAETLFAACADNDAGRLSAARNEAYAICAEIACAD